MRARNIVRRDLHKAWYYVNSSCSHKWKLMGGRSYIINLDLNNQTWKLDGRITHSDFKGSFNWQKMDFQEFHKQFPQFPE